MKTNTYLTLLFILLFSCKTDNSNLALIKPETFETTINGKAVALYTLHSGSGITMQVTNYGGRIVTLWTPDKNNNYEDIVLGFDNIDKYINNEGERFLGPVVGRYANRIAKASFVLDSVRYTLPANNNGNSLHGGLKGFDSNVWNVDGITNNMIIMSYESPDGDEGFPGTVSVKMIYQLTDNKELVIKYEATTDKPTHINLTNHSQFNLKGAGNGTVMDHLMSVNASHTTPVDSLLIPIGEIASVDGTPFDFRNEASIGERIDTDSEQLKFGKGYDHNWVIDRKTEKEVEHVASLFEPVSGRMMEVWSDQPGIQIYTGNFFTGKVLGKYAKPLLHRGAVALEVQKFPDTPNQPDFPSTRINPGEIYKQTCIYKFSVKK